MLRITLCLQLKRKLTCFVFGCACCLLLSQIFYSFLLTECRKRLTETIQIRSLKQSVVLKTFIITIMKCILVFILWGEIDGWILMSGHSGHFPFLCFPFPNTFFIIGAFSCLSLSDVIPRRGIIFSSMWIQHHFAFPFPDELNHSSRNSPVRGTSLNWDGYVLVYCVCVCYEWKALNCCSNKIPLPGNSSSCERRASLCRTAVVFVGCNTSHFLDRVFNRARRACDVQNDIFI